MNRLSKKLLSKKNALYNVIIIAALVISAAFLLKQRNTNTYIFDINDFGISHDDGFALKSPVFSIPKGNYVLNLSYISDCEAELTLSLDNDEILTNALPISDNGTAEISFSLGHSTDKAYFTVTSSNEISLYNIGLICDTYLHTDYFFYVIITIFLAAAVILILIKYPFMEYKKYWIFFVSLIVVVNLPLIFTKNVEYLVDTRAHMLRIEGIYRGLQGGQKHVLVYPNMDNQFGQTATLYPGTFLYIPAFMRLFDVSMMAIYRVCCYAVNIATVFTTFFCAKKLFKDDNKAFITTFMYVFGFYRIEVTYVGGMALGSVLAMVFYPLVVLGIYSIFYDDDKKEWWTLPIGLTCIFASHVLSLVMMLIMCMCFAVFNINKLIKKDVLLLLCKSVLLTILLSFGNIYAFMKFWYWG